MAADVSHEVIIGLEVHVQLKTKTKLFCGCSAQFGGDPNTQTCPVCLGLPGSLPVMNQRAFELALKTAIALNCSIPERTKWDRKNYYYPDLPKGYQISQYDLPMSEHGFLEISDPRQQFEPKRIRILRAHLEEDAGKSLHDEAASQVDSRIDLNRTGTPLLEIVSQPDLRSPLEAKTYLTELKLLLNYLQVSDCNMQEGSLRVDANINLHIHANEGTIATPIVEIKNMNSFRAVERALEYEATRQLEHWQKTGQRLGDVPKQTRGWDDQRQVTVQQRSKEESSDYRYFPDPDLVPATVPAGRVDQVREEMVELPAALRTRLQSSYQLSPYDADVLVNQGRPVVDYFSQVVEQGADAKRASNWIQQDVLRTLNERQIQIDQFPLTPTKLAELLKRLQEGQMDNTRAREVFAAMLENGESVEQTMQQMGITVLDASALEQICLQLIEENPAVVNDIRNGKKQAVGSLIGQAKRANPNVNPNEVRSRLLELIEQS